MSLLASQESSLLADLWQGHNTDLLLPLAIHAESLSREKNHSTPNSLAQGYKSSIFLQFVHVRVKLWPEE